MTSSLSLSVGASVAINFHANGDFDNFWLIPAHCEYLFNVKRISNFAVDCIEFYTFNQ